MKNILVFFLFFVFCFSCNHDESDYETNLYSFKNLIKEINSYFIDAGKNNLEISEYYTEDFVFYSYPAGYKKGLETSKVEYIRNLNNMKEMNILINIGHTIYLPGIDQKSHKIDGSVRVYYGAKISIDTNNVEFSGYQTVNFKEGKISAIWEWSDYGGVSNQLNEFVK